MKNAKNAKFCMFFSHFSGGFWEKTLQKGPKIDQKSAQTLQKNSICVPFGAVHGFSRLAPDWFPTGFRNLPNWMIS